MNGDRLSYLMIVVIALMGVGLFAIPVKADEFALARRGRARGHRS